MGEQEQRERIQAWVNEMEELKKEAIKVAREVRSKEWEYYHILESIADCERVIREGEEPGEEQNG